MTIAIAPRPLRTTRRAFALVWRLLLVLGLLSNGPAHAMPAAHAAAAAAAAHHDARAASAADCGEMTMAGADRSGVGVPDAARGAATPHAAHLAAHLAAPSAGCCQPGSCPCAGGLNLPPLAPALVRVAPGASHPVTAGPPHPSYASPTLPTPLEPPIG